MLDQLPSQHHVCGMGNLYDSAKFCREALIGKNKVMVHEITHRNKFGLSPFVIKEELKIHKEARRVQRYHKIRGIRRRYRIS